MKLAKRLWGFSLGFERQRRMQKSCVQFRALFWCIQCPLCPHRFLFVNVRGEYYWKSSIWAWFSVYSHPIAFRLHQPQYLASTYIAQLDLSTTVVSIFRLCQGVVPCSHKTPLSVGVRDRGRILQTRQILHGRTKRLYVPLEKFYHREIECLTVECLSVLLLYSIVLEVLV